MKAASTLAERQAGRRDELLDACAEAFARRGLHQTSMRDLCGALGLSAGALYRWFPSKEAIIESIIERDRAGWEGLFATIPPDASLAAALASIEEAASELLPPAAMALNWQVCAEASINPRIAKLLAHQYEAFTGQLASLLRRAQARGEMAPGISATAAARFVVACFDGLLSQTSFDPRIDARALSRSLRPLVLRALAPAAPAAKAPARRRGAKAAPKPARAKPRPSSRAPRS